MITTQLKTEQLLATHEAWRATTLNLIASENLISPRVRSALSNDLVGRYTDYTGRDLNARKYRGNRYVVEIEREAEALAKQLFRAAEVDLRPLSGHIAGACVVLGLCAAGDTILEVGGDGGSHRMAAKLAESHPIQIKTQFLPFDESRWNVDVDAAIEMIHAMRPKMVILGSSAFLFPHPIKALAAALHEIPGALLVYDASHVLGLIAGDAFQDPLAEGADVVYGSTHKTLPGPQGGIIYSNRADLMDSIATAIYPPLVTNHHSFKIPALALAFDEMLRHGADYARQVIANTRALGDVLEALDAPPVRVDGRCSDSHTLLLPTAKFPPNAAERLEAGGIIAGAFRVPAALGGAGLRIGTQEITRQGAHEEDMAEIAALIAAGLQGEVSSDELAARVLECIRHLPGLAFA